MGLLQAQCHTPSESCMQGGNKTSLHMEHILCTIVVGKLEGN